MVMGEIYKVLRIVDIMDDRNIIKHDETDIGLYYTKEDAIEVCDRLQEEIVNSSKCINPNILSEYYSVEKLTVQETSVGIGTENLEIYNSVTKKDISILN